MFYNCVDKDKKRVKAVLELQPSFVNKSMLDLFSMQLRNHMCTPKTWQQKTPTEYYAYKLFTVLVFG